MSFGRARWRREIERQEIENAEPFDVLADFDRAAAQSNGVQFQHEEGNAAKDAIKQSLNETFIPKELRNSLPIIFTKREDGTLPLEDQLLIDTVTTRYEGIGAQWVAFDRTDHVELRCPKKIVRTFTPDELTPKAEQVHPGSN